MERPKKKIVIIDASVVVKWFVQEEYTKNALRIRDDYRKGSIDLLSTQLMPFEVLNALRYNPELGQDQVEKASTALSKYRVALHPMLDGLAGSCIKIALKRGITIYDAVYVALGQLLDKELYTADDKLLIKVAGKEKIRHIREY